MLPAFFKCLHVVVPVTVYHMVPVVFTVHVMNLRAYSCIAENG
jgi:hypothetical protein